MTTSSSGIGRLKPPLLALLPWASVMAPVFADDTAMRLANDLYFGGHPPAPVEIPFGWLRAPVRLRQDNPYTIAEVTTSDSDNATDFDTTATRQWKFTAQLDTIAGLTDAANLAAWVIDYYDTSRPRGRDLRLRLNSRTDLEIQRILSVAQGGRIQITDLPTGYPTGASELVVEGIRHEMDAAVRDVIWNAVPVIGAELGEAGPWFRLDETVLGDTDELLPF